MRCKDINKDNNSTHFTFSVLFVDHKRGEVEMSHVPYWYDKEQLPSLTSTQHFFFDEFHIQEVSGTPTTSKFNEHNIRFSRYEYRNINVKGVNMA